MLDPNDIAAYHANLSIHEERAMQERLELFQAFTRLYDHHRDLLDDLLTLPDVNHAPQSCQFESFYVQGIVSPHQVYLVSNLVESQSRCFTSAKGQWTLGRDPRQSTLAVKDKRLSRCHAVIQYGPDQGFWLTDLESTNGTYINGKQINRLCMLQDGDQIRLGSLPFSFYTCVQMPCSDVLTTLPKLQVSKTASESAGATNVMDTLRILRPDFLI